MQMQGGKEIIKVENLSVWFGPKDEPIKAVDGVDFSIPEGRTVALVGESGCGKSVTALSMAKLVPEPPARYETGKILLSGENVLKMGGKRLSDIRGSEISYVFQEPGMALNPVFKVGSQIMEAVKLHQKNVSPKDKAIELMKMVGLPEPEKRMNSYPHEMSGGMQQRSMIAMALASSPRLLVADEATTALDVTIQAQILELLVELQKKMGMAVLVITHNLGLVADLAHTVNVMYAGRIVESGLVEDVLSSPAHPYSRGLLDAVPRLENKETGAEVRLKGIDGSVPNPASLPKGCKFAPRCSFKQPRCIESEPELGEIAVNGRDRCVRCFYPLGGNNASA